MATTSYNPEDRALFLHLCVTAGPRLYMAASLDVIARHYDVPRAALLSRDRHGEVAWARQVAATLFIRLGMAGHHSVGRYLRRDHGTICHALRAVADRCAVDAKARAGVAALEAALRQKFHLKEAA